MESAEIHNLPPFLSPVYSPGAGNISVEHYSYNAMSRLSSTYREEDGLSDNFGYDASGQLNSANYRNNARWVGYSWDNAGNRTQVNDTGWAYGYGVNSLNQYGWTGDGGGISNGDQHEVRSYQGITYGYYGDTRLASVSGPGGNYNLYYDGLGRTVQRNLNGVATYYIYDGEKPIYEYKADGSTAGWNVYGKGIDEPLLRADYVAAPGGQGYFFQQDHEGSVTHLTGWGGEVIESYRYDAFGAPTTTYSAGNFNNRFKFTGREYVPQFGFYEYRNRAYHPGLGRFMSEDPIGFSAGDYNLFRYCGNDPVDKTDPMGLFVDRTWDRQMYMQGGEKRSFEVVETIKDLHSKGWVTVGRMLFTERNKTDSTPGKPARNLGGAKLDQLGGEMARLAFNTGPPGQEQISWLFEKNGTPGAYAASVPIPGGAEPKQYRDEGNAPRLGVPSIPNFIPKGYHYVGFAYSHLLADKVIPLIDRQRAWRSRADAYMSVPHQGSRFPDVVKPYRYDPNVFPTN